MRGAIIHSPGDVRVTASCVCGSALWSFRGTEPVGIRRVTNTLESSKTSVPTSRTSLWATSWQARSWPQITAAKKGLIHSLLAASDVRCTGWFGAVAAEAGPGKTVVVGGGRVGLPAVLAAKQLGAQRIMAMSRHESRQKLAREFGATGISTEGGEEGVAKIKELTNGPAGYVGVAPRVELPGEELCYADVHLHGRPAAVRRFLPEPMAKIWNRQIDPG